MSPTAWRRMMISFTLVSLNRHQGSPIVGREEHCLSGAAERPRLTRAREPNAASPTKNAPRSLASGAGA
jgi:hypothetical protein